MSLALDNIYSGNDAVSDILARIEQHNHIDKYALCLLLQNSMVAPKIKEEALYRLSTYNPVYIRIWIDYIKEECVYFHDSNLLNHYKMYITGKIRSAYILTDSEIAEIYCDLCFMIANGIAEFYPYIWHLFNRRGKASSAYSEEYRAMSYYSIVFAFDGYNGKNIKKQLKQSPSYIEGEFEVFSELKTRSEKAYSKFGLATLSTMQDAFRHRRSNEDRFAGYLMSIPREYKDRLHVSTLLNNGERLYYSFRRFFEDGGVYKVHYFPFNDDKQTGV